MENSIVSHPLRRVFLQFASDVKARGSIPTTQEREKMIHSKTTVLAMKFLLRVREDTKEKKIFHVPAVIIASDGRTTAHRIESDVSKKIRLIDERTAIGSSGVCFLIHKIAKYLELEVRDYDDNVDPVEQRLTLRSKADKLGHIAGQFVGTDWPIGFVLVGYEEHENRCRIFTVGNDGFVIDKGDFGGEGSGYDPVIGLLKLYAGKEYTIRRVVNTMKRILKSALEEDQHSGGECRGIIITPIGYKEVSLNA
ncbi:MAG: hypothetical protein HZA36_00015 [Parcubacteria group bacterium]|nr:hypothetical protein [Parcubacteria group bacterium]